jgi:hypothetical protein
MFICVFMGAVAFESCSKEDNTRSIVATIVKTEKPDPYTYTLRIRVESCHGETFKPGEQITVAPNYIYVAPSLLDMTKATNHSLMELAKMNPGERIDATVARSSDGSWLLIDGRKL